METKHGGGIGGSGKSGVRVFSKKNIGFGEQSPSRKELVIRDKYLQSEIRECVSLPYGNAGNRNFSWKFVAVICLRSYYTVIRQGGG